MFDYKFLFNFEPNLLGTSFWRLCTRRWILFPGKHSSQGIRCQ